MKTIANLLRAFVLAGAALALTACSSMGQVMPWDKGMLAKPEMTFSGDRIGTTFSEHIYSSREGASGGSGASGGGCGCY